MAVLNQLWFQQIPRGTKILKVAHHLYAGKYQTTLGVTTRETHICTYSKLISTGIEPVLFIRY
jgi:hypothetical protein